MVYSRQMTFQQIRNHSVIKWLYPGMRICQVAFLRMSSPAQVTYDRKPGSKYMDQSLPQESKLTMDEEFSSPRIQRVVNVRKGKAAKAQNA